jgi:DUF1009 family protein
LPFRQAIRHDAAVAAAFASGDHLGENPRVPELPESSNRNPAADAPIGLIAGGGELPVIIARGIRAAGRQVAGIGLRGHFDPTLPDLCDRFAEAGTIKLGQWCRLARRMGAREAIMVGRVSKLRMHDPIAILRELPDLRAIRFWYRRMRGPDRRSSVLLAAVADELLDGGVRLIDSTRYIPDQLAGEGVMGRVAPTPRQLDDVAMGWPILRQVAQMDVGQTIAMRAGDVVAVEAAEGTDRVIERAGSLSRLRGWTLLKTARDEHDTRSDVPTVGVATIENLAKAGGGCLALGVGRVILVDKPVVLAAADRAKIAVVGIPAEGVSRERLAEVCGRGGHGGRA